MKTYRPVFTRELIVIDVLGNIVFFLLIVSPLVFWTWVAYGSESSFLWRLISFIPPFALVVFVFPYLARVQWKMWIRKERWATYCQTRNTLAIKIPLQPIKFIKKRDCVGFVPGGEGLILPDGTIYKLPGVPAAGDHDLSRGEVILKSWWTEIDIERMRARRNRKLPNPGVVFVTVVAAVILYSSIQTVFKYSDISATDEVRSFVVKAWLMAFASGLSWWMLRPFYDFKVPLPIEQVDQVARTNSVASGS